MQSELRYGEWPNQSIIGIVFWAEIDSSTDQMIFVSFSILWIGIICKKKYVAAHICKMLTYVQYDVKLLLLLHVGNR